MDNIKILKHTHI